jgi:hypothetical protein
MTLTNQMRFCVAAVLSRYRECTAIFKGKEQAVPATRNRQEVRSQYSPSAAARVRSYLFFNKNNMTVVPHPPTLLSSVSATEYKTERPPF